MRLTNKTECERKFYVFSAVKSSFSVTANTIVRGHYIVSWCPANSEIVTRTGNQHRSFHNAWDQYRNRRSSGTTLRAPAYKNKWNSKMLRCSPYGFYSVLGKFCKSETLLICRRPRPWKTDFPMRSWFISDEKSLFYAGCLILIVSLKIFRHYLSYRLNHYTNLQSFSNFIVVLFA